VVVRKVGKEKVVENLEIVNFGIVVRVDAETQKREGPNWRGGGGDGGEVGINIVLRKKATLPDMGFHKFHCYCSSSRFIYLQQR